MKIAMVASEACPYVKTGGLADVVYSLSKELVTFGEEAAIFLPLYNHCKRKVTNLQRIGDFMIHLGWRMESANLYLEKKDGISFYFIENRHYFERDAVYGYDDDGERFAFFAQAVISAMQLANYKPNIIHLHDWQAGMVPCLIKENKYDFFKNTKYVLTIHNPAFQGLLDRYSLGDLYNLPDYLFENGNVEFKGMVSTLKTGIIYSEKITTVSPTHRNELLTPEGSMGLDCILRLREFDFCGFLNGIDYSEFNPETDKNIYANYNADTFIEGKKKNKVALFEEYGLSNPEAPLFALVSRVTWQKGMTLVFAAVHEIVRRGGKVFLLGSGEYDYEQEMNRLHALYPDSVSVYIGYSDPLAHKVYAASDFFLMPSLFEPCGLGQMIAQRYGSLPIVRRVGGLKDSVINFDSGNLETSNGFGFDNFSEADMISTCHYAFDNYDIKYNFNHLVRNALLTNNTWKKSGELYLGLYKELVK